MKTYIVLMLSAFLISALPIWAEAEQEKSSATAPQCIQPCTPVRTSTAPQSSVSLKIQEQRLESFKALMDYQDKRVADLAFGLSISIALFGVLITAIVVFFSFRSTKEAVLAAKEEARGEVEKQANQIIGAWIEKDAQKLIEDKVETSLRPEVESALEKIQVAAKVVLDDLENEKQKAASHNAEQDLLNKQQKKAIQELVTRELDKQPMPLSPEQKQTVSDTAKNLESKPPKDYQFDDWYMLGIQAYENNKYEVAIENFTKAHAVAVTEIQQAVSQLNIALALGRCAQYEKSIEACNEIIQVFGSSKDAVLHDMASRALILKGAQFNSLEKFDMAVTTFNDVLKANENPSTEMQIEQVSRALNGIGFTMMSRAKKLWKEGGVVAAKEMLNQALLKIEEALVMRPMTPIYLGNKGYALFLLARKEEAKGVLSDAINLGGEKLRQLELTDSNIYSLPEDEEFRSLIIGI